MIAQHMGTAPKDGVHVLVWARWDWAGMYGIDYGEPFYWRVASWDEDEGCFWGTSSNPYRDCAVDARYWAPLPDVTDAMIAEGNRK